MRYMILCCVNCWDNPPHAVELRPLSRVFLPIPRGSAERPNRFLLGSTFFLPEPTSQCAIGQVGAKGL